MAHGPWPICHSDAFFSILIARWCPIVDHQTHGATVPNLISYADFERIDVRVGRITRADEFPEARKPAYRLVIDFGVELGTRTSSAQLTLRYTRSELEGRLVVAVVNFPARQIGPFKSEVLTLGVPDEDGGVVLLVPDKPVPLGARMF
jgi:tRNA-binding protein